MGILIEHILKYFSSILLMFFNSELEGPEPEDVRYIKETLNFMGVQEYEPEVLAILLNFMHQYTWNLKKTAIRVNSSSGRPTTNLTHQDVIVASQTLSASRPRE